MLLLSCRLSYGCLQSCLQKTEVCSSQLILIILVLMQSLHSIVKFLHNMEMYSGIVQ